MGGNQFILVREEKEDRKEFAGQDGAWPVHSVAYKLAGGKPLLAENQRLRRLVAEQQRTIEQLRQTIRQLQERLDTSGLRGEEVETALILDGEVIISFFLPAGRVARYYQPVATLWVALGLDARYR
jgi:hypothetical protein